MNSSFFVGALFVVALVLFYFAYRHKDELKNLTSKVKIPTAFRKVPLPKGRRKIAVLVGVLILVLGVIGYFWFSNKLVSKPTVMDDLPIWLLRDGKVAVYREMEIGNGSVTANVVVSNLGNEDQSNVQIYETIPKEIAQSASTLEFSSEPEIIEDDPIILWDVGNVPRSEPVTIGFSVRNEKDIRAMLEIANKKEPGWKNLKKSKRPGRKLQKNSIWT